MSTTTLFILAAIAVLVLTLAAVGVHLIARLRAQEAAGSDPASPASGDSLSEMREIGQRIETLVSQQQEQGETQRQRLAQQIDTVQQTVGEQRVLVDGLRSEVRHESKRRDHELDEIRTQIASIQQAIPALTGAPALELPPATEDAPAVADEPIAEDTPVEALTEDTTPADAVYDDMFMEVVDPFALESLATTEPTDTHEPVELEDPEQDDSVAADVWTPDWSEATLPHAEIDEAAEIDKIDEAPIETEPPHIDVFAEVSPFDVATPVHEDAPQAHLEDATSMDTPMEMDTFAEAETSPDEFLFEELAIAEMSFVDPEPQTHAFNPEEAANEIDSIEAALSDMLPAAPAAEESESSVFVDAVVPTEMSPAETVAEAAPESMSEPKPAQAEAPEADPIEDDIFAPTPFLNEAVPTADPLAFEETFVPTPVESPAVDTPEVDAPSEDVFASWSPSSFETTAPAAPALPTLSFTDTPAENPSDAAPVDMPNEPKISESELSPVDLSSFEDWGLDPEPVAAPPTWAPTGSPDTTFEAWAPAPQAPAPQAPAPQAPASQAPATDPPSDPESPAATAWVVRNENLHPPHPPVSDEPEMQEDTPVYDEPVYDEPVYDEPVYEAQIHDEPVYDAPIQEEPIYTEPASEAIRYEEAPVLSVAPATPPPPAAEPQAAAAPPPVSFALTASTPAPQPEPTPEPVAASGSAPEPEPLPEGAERLSVLPSIDDDLERALHLAGVTTLDDMARWGRTEARRIAGAVGVSEETVLNHWVFEAQTALFERFTLQASS